MKILLRFLMNISSERIRTCKTTEQDRVKIYGCEWRRVCVNCETLLNLSFTSMRKTNWFFQSDIHHVHWSKRGIGEMIVGWPKW